MSKLSFNSGAKKELDRWLIIGEHYRDIEHWIDANLNRYQLFNRNQWVLVSPIFDRLDFFEIKMLVPSSNIDGLIFHEYIDIRENYIKQPYGDEDDMTYLVTRSVRKRDTAKTFISPRPEPIGGECDRLDLCGRWLTPDPFIYQISDDQCSIPDVQGWMDAPEWLRKGCRPSLRPWSSPTR